MLDVDLQSGKEEIIHLSNKVSIVIFRLEEKPKTNQALNMLKTCTIIWSKFERFQASFLVCDKYVSVGSTIFSASKKPMILSNCFIKLFLLVIAFDEN